MAVIGFSMIACDNSNENGNNNSGKTIDPRLIGKWEWKKMFTNEVQTDLTSMYRNSGFHFNSNGYTAYRNGNLMDTYTDLYTENDRFYSKDGTHGTPYSIDGDKLTWITWEETGNMQGVIMEKVTTFSWE